MPSSQGDRPQTKRPNPKNAITLPERPVSVRALTLAITTALFISVPATTQAGTLPATLNLSELDGSNGFVLNGGAVYDRSGISVSGAGDLNGDGIDDVIVGASRADPNGINSGAAYVIFGSTGGLPSPLVPGDLDGTNGFVLNGEVGNDEAGGSVSAAGDINGDGIDDLIIGAAGADPNGNSSGRSYVVFGSKTGFPASLDLSTLNGANGFALNGEAAEDNSGDAVSAAGDVNGDGIDDLIVGADDASPNGDDSGRSYVVFGSDKGFQSTFDLSSLDGSNGFAMNGAATYDNAGRSVSSAGDFNGDGIDDVIIGASGEDAEEYSSGRAYVVFGSNQPFPTPIDLISLDGTNGIVLTGLEENTSSVFNVSAAGD
ncbi:MAG: integrin alpha, partial [Wenzhouxiangella sp.]|nr:integrin alpha [Wenzhouxiangella sp.]